jgi:hypothetical protein
MRMFVSAALLAAFAAASAQAQPGPQPLAGASGPVCLRPFDTAGEGGLIRTHVVDPQTILFYTPDGKVWKNTLKSRCRGLMFHGFEYVTHQDEICSNAQAIRVITTGEVCELGSFAPYAAPSANP